MSSVLEKSFWQLLIVYSILIFAIAIGQVFKYMLHFEIFAVVVALIGAWTLKKEKDFELSSWFLLAVLAIILVTRLLPYIGNSIPLGYDPGMYKSAFETFFSGNPDPWVLGWSPRGLFLLTNLVLGLGLTSDQLLIGGFIFLEILLCMSLYVVGKEFFGKTAGIVSAILYSISIVHFRAFSLMYYKNILAMGVLLAAVYFVRKKNKIPAILAGSFLFALHRPTFLLFGLSYLGFMIFDVIDVKKIKKFELKKWKKQIDWKKFKDDFIMGLGILILGFIYQIGVFNEVFLHLAGQAVGGDIGGGTFINFFTYQYSSLFYLLFGCLGFFLLAKDQEFNQAFFLMLFTGLIVYFQIIFHNRFIIHLDFVLVLAAGYGISRALSNKKWFALSSALLLLTAGTVLVYSEADGAFPYVRGDELQVIGFGHNTEPDATFMVTNAHYSPWGEGYSGRPTIAPGLFDLNEWNRATWTRYWATPDPEAAVAMLQDYPRPLYIFSGRRDRENKAKYNSTCFEIVAENKVRAGVSRLYKVVC